MARNDFRRVMLPWKKMKVGEHAVIRKPLEVKGVE